MISLADTNILVTGGYGFLGRRLIDKLIEKNSEVHRFRRAEFNLIKEDEVKDAFDRFMPKIVIHLAGDVGGIGYNREHPGTILYNNLMMNTLVQEMARRKNVEKFIGIGSVCAYPKYCPVPFKEDDLWNGYPEETNASYGLAKKMILVQSQEYRREFNMNAIHLLMVNMYGPGDNFDPDTSHVIPAMIKKVVDAKLRNEDRIILWGDGTPTREFLYVDDSADAIILATERYDKIEPVNIGTGSEISMKDLINIIAQETDFNGEIIWDRTKPNGQPKRCLDISRALTEFGFKATTDLRTGLRKTIEWYFQQRGIKNEKG